MNNYVLKNTNWYKDVPGNDLEEIRKVVEEETKYGFNDPTFYGWEKIVNTEIPFDLTQIEWSVDNYIFAGDRVLKQHQFLVDLISSLWKPQSSTLEEKLDCDYQRVIAYQFLFHKTDSYEMPWGKECEFSSVLIYKELIGKVSDKYFSSDNLSIHDCFQYGISRAEYLINKSINERWYECPKGYLDNWFEFKNQLKKQLIRLINKGNEK